MSEKDKEYWAARSRCRNVRDVLARQSIHCEVGKLKVKAYLKKTPEGRGVWWTFHFSRDPSRPIYARKPGDILGEVLPPEWYKKAGLISWLDEKGFYRNEIRIKGIPKL